MSREPGAVQSGLQANSIALSVIGNNLANTNTVGFKASSVTFHDLVSQTLKLGGGGGNPVQVGLGVITGTISPTFSQGSIESTNEPTNVAIQGDGFFMVGKDDGFAYTLAGDFSFDADGRLVSSDGAPVQGWSELDPTSGDILTASRPSEIIIPPGVLRDPTATTSFQAISNLDADALVGDTFSTTIEIIDSLGAPHLATINYTNTAAGAWDYDITVPGAAITGGTAGTPFSVGAGAIGFDAFGVLNDVDGGAPRPEYDEALAALQSLQHELEDRNQSAAGSLAEGLDETLTLHRLGVYGVLGRSLKTTNGLESINALIEERCAKVDHWQNSSQRHRWLATALLDIEPRLRKVMGYRHLPRLRDALKRQLKIDTTTLKKKAA